MKLFNASPAAAVVALAATAQGVDAVRQPLSRPVPGAYTRPLFSLT